MPVKFHLPNFVNLYSAQLNFSTILLLKENPELFYEGVQIASVFDSFPVAWNGGRIVAGHMTSQMIEQNVPPIFKMFNDLGVACRLTFSNPLIKKQHLSDVNCNRILELAENGLNGAIVQSEPLEAHIRKTFPRIRLTSSTCKQLKTLESISEELEKDFDLVVLDYNVNRDLKLLERIPHKERCEILVNAICNPDCPRRGEHYRYIGAYQLEHSNKEAQQQCGLADMDWKCENLKKDVIERRSSPNYLSPEDIYERLNPLGYCNFKLEGRGNPIADLIEQYVYFLVRPEHAQTVRIKLMSDIMSLRRVTA